MKTTELLFHFIFLGWQVFQPLLTIISSSGKSKIMVAWKPMLVAAIQYSKNENQLNAVGEKVTCQLTAQ